MTTPLDLQERMMWRREMVYKSIRETFTALEVMGSMYRLKLSRVDERGHRYLVMVDIGASFTVGDRIRTRTFAGIEALIKKNTYEKYGVIISGMYWRTDDDVNVFDKLRQPAAVGIAPVPVERRTQPRNDSIVGPVTPAEAEAFTKALKAGLAVPPIHVGQRMYHSDVAPLMDDMDKKGKVGNSIPGNLLDF